MVSWSDMPHCHMDEICAEFSAASRRRKRRGGVGPLDVPART